MYDNRCEIYPYSETDISLNYKIFLIKQILLEFSPKNYYSI